LESADRDEVVIEPTIQSPNTQMTNFYPNVTQP